MELTKSKLKELSNTLDAYYFGGNVYQYENDIYYLTHYQFNRIDIDSNSLRAENIKKCIKWLDDTYGLNNFNELTRTNPYRLHSTQIAYSRGVYGNSGQLHRIDIYSDNEIIRSFYTYYC